MAAWQLVALCTVLFSVVAGAQESTLDAATLADNPPGAFVYVPSTTIEGQITAWLAAADSLEVGFVTENGTSVTNTISSGASAVFPQGLIHYQYNSGCSNATYTISYGSELPGTQVVTQGLLNLPENVLAASLGIEKESSSRLAGQVPTNRFVGNVADCEARCGNTTASLSAAGRRKI